MTDLPRLLGRINDLALAAGARAMEIYGSDFEVETKDDSSPVTRADRLGEEMILRGLAEAYPDIPVLAEEAAAEGRIPRLGARFFLVDPLDGTKEFIRKTGEFTVNIAYVEDGAAIAGVVYAPAAAALYYGAAGLGAFRRLAAPAGDAGTTGATATPDRPIATRTPPAAGLAAVVSRSHRTPQTDEFLKDYHITDYKAAGSSLKFCLLAAGEADIYPRLGRTMEWDTAAGQAVLEAAGGRVVDLETGARLHYGKRDRGFDNPHFCAYGQ